MSAAAPVRAQQAIEALARLDAAYSHGAEMPWGDLGIVLEFARQQAAADLGPTGGRVQVTMGATVPLPGTSVQVTNAGVQGGRVTLDYRSPADPPAPSRAGPCRDCGQPFSPNHDVDAPGGTSRHSFIPRWPSPAGVRSEPRGVCT